MAKVLYEPLLFPSFSTGMSLALNKADLFLHYPTHKYVYVVIFRYCPFSEILQTLLGTMERCSLIVTGLLEPDLIFFCLFFPLTAETKVIFGQDKLHTL